MCCVDTKNEKRTRRKYTDGLPDTAKFKSGGVKKLIVLGVFPDAKEEPELLEEFFQKLNLEPGSFLFCADLKLINIVLGLGTHASKHPSPFCDWEKNTENPCNLRTFEEIREKLRQWIEAGSDPKTAMDFNNCIREPLSIFPGSGAVILFHSLSCISRWVSNKLYAELESIFPETREWAEKLHVVKEDYYKKFEG